MKHSAECSSTCSSAFTGRHAGRNNFTGICEFRLCSMLGLVIAHGHLQDRFNLTKIETLTPESAQTTYSAVGLKRAASCLR